MHKLMILFGINIFAETDDVDKIKTIEKYLKMKLEVKLPTDSELDEEVEKCLKN